MCIGGFETYLLISDPELLDEIYVVKNKYFDKHPQMNNVANPLLGDNVILEPSGEH
jgi:hypothetical protein